MSSDDGDAVEGVDAGPLGESGVSDDTDTSVSTITPHRTAAVERDRAYLVVLAGVSRGEMFKLDVPRSVIGRSPNAQIRLSDDGVSREHAAIALVGDKVILDDMGSTNGTFCNGVRVTSRELTDGDKIMIGSTTILKFTYHDQLDEAFQQQMYESALRDGLTKVFNRKHFNDLLAKEFAYSSRHAAPLALLFVDLDFFKKVNDAHGHPAGDFILSEVSGVLAGAIRSEDVLARFGGEEFCVLCRGTERSGAVDLGERLRKEIADRRYIYGGKIIPVTISVGIALMPDPSMTQPAGLLAAADKALYEAKRAGRNRVVVAVAGNPG
ncbi:MAG: diguanylate cyclase [Deltaproteobacteria bacterium]|nr:diguanylate cyclase [Deltaproteobacteria bacterium]